MGKRYSVLSRPQTSEYEEKLNELADHCRANGTIQHLAVAMASILQRELSRHNELPHEGALDNIMRAVEHTLRGDPSMYGYVLEKLNFGTDCMNSWLKSEDPQIAA